ncbi:MAG TPA: hydrogenase subunit MbhD domain-containing protein [Acidimicrobiales bacterium]|nr:hydrogenase subunit MbhD domain-containing protein [Acidimicrobiales bacterium]
MSQAVVAASLTFVLLMGTAVALSNAPERQAVTLSVLGLGLTVLFLALQAPDVALSQLGVGSAVLPLMVMLAVRKVRSIR